MSLTLKSTLTPVLLLLCVAVSAQELFPFEKTDRTVISPEVSGDTVTFRLDASYASYVTIHGSWQQPGSEPVPMFKNRSGIWEVSFTGMFPDLHNYLFEVDGVPVLDPSNHQVGRSAQDAVNLFYLDGPRTKIYHPARRRGTVSYVWYDSRFLGAKRRMAVYLPYGYDPAQKKSYPVLYLLHGEGQDEESWINTGMAANILDNLIQSGRAVPMIVVMPNCNVKQQAAPHLGMRESARNLTPSSFSYSLTDEIIPYVESHYKTYKTKLMRGVAGVDTGGDQALSTVLSHPDLFDYVCLLSSGVAEYPALQSDLLRWKRAKFKLIWQGCGIYDERANQDVRRLYNALQTVDMDNSLCMSNGGHEWRNWRYYFGNFVPILFKY